jgi:hypothetical protein
MSCYFDNEKINKSTHISELFTYKMSEAAEHGAVCFIYTFIHVDLNSLKSVISQTTFKCILYEKQYIIP